MARRVLAGVAAGWLSLYLLTYVWVVAAQEGEVARWYVALCVLALLASVAAAVGVVPRTSTTTALICTTAATLAGALTMGLLLLPAVLALAVAASRSARVPPIRSPRT